MSISRRDAKLLLILLGIIILVAAYLAVYNPYNSKTEALEAETDALGPQLSELKDHLQKLNSYEAGIDDAQRTIDEEMESYPNDVRPEDLVMFAIRLESAMGLNISSIGFSPRELLLGLPLPQQDESNSHRIKELTAYDSGMTISFALGYRQLKDTLEFLANMPQRTALDNLSVSFNSEDGKLLGTAAISKYFISSADDVYEETIVPTVPIGTNDLFGTFTAAARTED